MEKLFISGMFRSGTTFLARMLNVHSKIACASDPLRPLFNSFRFEFKKNQRGYFDPLEDYFLNNNDILQEILDSNLNKKISIPNELLLKTILHSAMPYSGKWTKKFDKNKTFSNYSDFIEYSLNLIHQIYGNQDTKIIAFKEVWTNEFIPSFLNTFSNSKAIILLRDPRAVVAFNIVSGEKYPIFFLARQWRKLAFLSQIIKERFKR